MGNYKMLRTPLAAHIALIDKKRKIEDRLFNITRHKVPVPLTKLINLMAGQQLMLGDEDIVRIFGRLKRR